MDEQGFRDKLEQEIKDLEQNPQMRGEVLSSPIPDAFVEECKTRDGAERVVKAAYIAGMVAAVDDPVGCLQRLAKHFGMEVMVVDGSNPDGTGEKLN